MNLDTPEGALTIDDDKLTFKPSDDGPELDLSLDPMPEWRYERGVYGLGTLVVGTSPEQHVIVLRNEQATAVAEELRRPRASRKASKTATSKADSDAASAS